MTHLTKRLPVRGLTRRLLRLPIWLYRARLGWLLGSRFLLLTHTGRRTGQARQVVLEVVRRAPEDGSFIVASGWGERSDWLLNVAQTPAVQVQVGSRTLPALAGRLSPAEASHALAAYAQEHPFAFRTLVRQMLGRPLDGSRGDIEALVANVPLVRLSPQPGRPLLSRSRQSRGAHDHR